ncbi:ribonuclease H-like domain-containing protein [Mycena leptocephala]|nr:ribonuclease H-like domain-containing protein [Mycena leptocephala]
MTSRSQRKILIRLIQVQQVEKIQNNQRGLHHPQSEWWPSICSPCWLMNPFRANVAASAIRGTDRLPALYRDNKSFWFPVQDPFFALENLESLAPEQMFLPSFFLWDPDALLPNGIPCPLCKHRLNRHGHIPRPRRCVDLDHTFWIIGYRYHCTSCINPQSKKKTITFQSWDSRIISSLPRRLAVRFPAMLTHRSAISESLFMFMRSCFQSGMGAKQFSDALRVRHLEYYDKLQISYLWKIAEVQGIASWRGRKFNAFKPFDDTSAKGYHGFIPSSQWLRDLFDTFMEHHGHNFDQAMSMLSGFVNGVDHSFKVAKHIAKVNGEQVFIALLTVTNEKGEIRVCNLVATKSHSQFELALTRMAESLRRYGHAEPAIFYTDNMADKEFLERCFPSLRNGVVPVEKYAHLPALEISPNVGVCVIKSRSEIDTAMRTILQDVPDDSDNDPRKIIIFLDSEWNVEISDRGYLTGRGQTAILQIGYKNMIYIIQVCQSENSSYCSSNFQLNTPNPRVLKVGRAVSGDLKYLERATHPSKPFVGAVDLAKMAKDRLVVPNAKIGLADLCAVTLGMRLAKNVPERTSSAWENEDLSPSQIRYAALDVHACSRIYDFLSTIPIPALPRSWLRLEQKSWSLTMITPD